MLALPDIRSSILMVTNCGSDRGRLGSDGPRDGDAPNPTWLKSDANDAPSD